MTAQSRKNKAPQNAGRNQTIDQPMGAAIANKNVLQGFGLGSLQSWLFGTVAALTAATLILNSDALTLEGDNILVALVWSLLAGVLLFVRWHRKSPFCFVNGLSLSQQKTSQQNDASETLPRHSGWRWFDLVAAMFFGWVFVSFAVIWLSGNAAPRAMLTMLAHWGGFAGMFVTWRLLLVDRRMIHGMILLFLALVIAETTVAWYDYCYLGPQRRAAFLENPEQALIENNAISPGEQELLANRIKSPEPLGTYSLTNSLAGVLAPWFVFLCGLVLLRHHRSFDSLLQKQQLWPLALLVVVMAAYVGLILFATNSRSGVIAVLFGIVCLLGCMFANKIRNKNVLFGTAIACCLVVAAGVAVSFASGKINRDAISEASKSFGYRVQYWQSSSRMIADHPIVGCGIGNFREYYTQYKLPTASESIADPHNLFFEIATNAGLPALLCFIALLVAAIACPLFSRSKRDAVLPIGDSVACSNDEQSDRQHNKLNGNASRQPSNIGDAGNFFECLCASWRLYHPFVIGGFVGIIAAFVYSYTNYLALSPDITCFALAGFLLGCVLFLPLVALMPLPLRVLAPICLVVLIINLLAAGGISLPHVNVSFWFLAALCFCYASSGTNKASTVNAADHRNTNSRVNNYRFANFAFVCTALCLLMLTVALYPMAYLSNLQANSLLRNMQANPLQYTFLDKQIAEFEKIVERDPYRTQIWLDLNASYLLEQREFPAITKRRPDTSQWQNVLDRQWRKNRIPHDMRDLSHITLNGTTADALAGAVTSSPLSATMYQSLGLAFLDDFEKTQNTASLDLAILLFELAAARYPNHSLSYAYLAKAYGYSGETEPQQQAARKAVELDDITPHSDQKLPPELRRTAELLTGN